MTSTDILIRVHGHEFRARDLVMLKEWCAEGRVHADSMILLPGAAAWVPAAECDPLRAAFDRVRPDQVEGEWHLRAAGVDYVAPDYATLKEWHRAGRVPGHAVVYHASLGGWLPPSRVAGLEFPVARVLHKEKATYRGGIKGFPHEKAGTAFLTDVGFEFHGAPVHFDAAFGRIVSVTLEQFRPSAFRVLVVTSGTVPLVKNVLALTYLDEADVQRTAEFQIHGAVTLQGEAEKAAELVNRLTDFKHLFVRTDHTATPSLDAVSQLRELKSLLDAGVLTPEEFEEKKRVVLTRF
jgi:Short C-terminal domain